VQRTSIVSILVLLAVSIPGSFRAEAQSYKEAILYSFKGSSDGGTPTGIVLGPNGALYATAEIGGDLSCVPPLGCGVLLELSGPGDENVLHTFTGVPDAAIPADSSLILDSSGNIYGTTSEGGTICAGSAYGCGTVFSYSKGTESVLHSFSGPPDGDNAEGLVSDSEGNLYGVTVSGGTGPCSFGCGTIFEIPNGGSETVLYNFQGGSNGKDPYTIVRDLKGNLYGTTAESGCGSCGVVFKLDASGKETTLYKFSSGADGGVPVGITLGPNGVLYGATYQGGDLTCGNGTGCGVVFEFTGSGKETVLHTFTGGSDGANPSGSLIRDKAGNLYGTTYSGGNSSCACGTVFKIDTSGNKTVLYAFGPNPPDGAYPYGLVMNSAGNIYGVTFQGGEYGFGTIFKLEVGQ
jgi:uncharacterized repeat protein (TIGR03803 family)